MSDPPRRIGRFAGLVGLALFALAAGLVALSVGSSGASTEAWIRVLRGDGDAALRSILLDVRLPRVALAMIVGAALAGAGSAYQAVLRNPLADPFILGVSGGAAMGAVAFTALAGHEALYAPAGRPVAALAGAILTLVVLFGLARSRGRTEATALLLTGVVLNAFDSAVILFLVTAGDPSRFQGVLFFLMGALSSPTPATLAVCATLAGIGLTWLILHAHTLNLLSLGDEEAAALGVPVERASWTIVVSASLATAAAVSFAGIVGFVGLIVPHAVRRVVGPDHRVLVPASILAGAGFLALADGIARIAVAPGEMPVGVITAMVGGPFFLLMLLRKVRA